MKCILFGHRPSEPMRGAGQHSKTAYVVCLECGKTMSAVEGFYDEQIIGNAFQRIEAAPRGGND